MTGEGAGTAVLGDPGELEAAAGEISAAGRRLADAGESVAAGGWQLSVGWSGRAADVAHDRVVVLGRQAAVGLDVGARAAGVLWDFAAELRVAGSAAAAADANSRAAALVDEIVARLAALSPGPATRAVPVEYGAWPGPAATVQGSQHHGPQLPWTKLVSVPASLTAAAGDASARAGKLAQELSAALKLMDRGVTAAERMAYDAAERVAARAGGRALDLALYDAWTPGTERLARLNAVKVAVPVLEKVPLLSVTLTEMGVAMDVGSGMSLSLAVVKNVGSTAAGIAATAGLIALFGGATALAPAVLCILAGAAVSYAVSRLIGRYGGTVAKGVSRAAGAVAGALRGGWHKVFG